MRERILKFLNQEKLSSTKFADEIGVQRSSVSHILSGRNNPSFDFIKKIIVRYDNINAEWLITGRGEMFKVEGKLTAMFDDSVGDNVISKDKTEEIITESDKIIPEKDVGRKEVKETEITLEIEKVIIFYKDKSFKEYSPIL